MREGKHSMIRRREFLAVSGGAALAASTSARSWAQAQGWPNKPVRIVVPYAAGGATDSIARAWSEKLAQVFGQQFIIENRGGASGMIGAEAVAKSAPDGYTFLLVNRATLTVLPHLRKTPYDPFKSFDCVAQAGDVVCGFVIHPANGIKTFKEMVEFAKKNPGKLSFGSSGAGTGTHLRLEMLKQKAGIELLHVPYRGGADTVIDVLTNTVNMMNEPVSLPHVKAGKLILLNVNHGKRSEDFPDAPTLTELGYTDADVPLSFGVYGPAGLPPEIIATFNSKMSELSATDEMKAKLRTVYTVPLSNSPKEMLEANLKDSEISSALIKSANIKLE